MSYWRYIKKTNTRVDAYAAQIAKESEDVQALMTGQMTDLTGKIQAQKDDASADVFAAGVSNKVHGCTIQILLPEGKCLNATVVAWICVGLRGS